MLWNYEIGWDWNTDMNVSRNVSKLVNAFIFVLKLSTYGVHTYFHVCNNHISLVFCKKFYEISQYGIRTWIYLETSTNSVNAFFLSVKWSNYVLSTISVFNIVHKTVKTTVRSIHSPPVTICPSGMFTHAHKYTQQLFSRATHFLSHRPVSRRS